MVFRYLFFFVIVWPASFYLTEFVFDEQSFHLWIWLAIVWSFGAAGIIIFLPIIEARKNIIEVINKAKMNSDTTMMEQSDYSTQRRNEDNDSHIMKILVPIDGSARSLKSIYHANYLFRDTIRVRIYLVHVIAWTDKNGENIDKEMASQIREEGRLILRSVVVPKQINDYKRIVKLGDPAEKITELAEKLRVDMIIMNKKGIGKSTLDLGKVTQKVLKLASKPVVLLD